MANDYTFTFTDPLKTAFVVKPYTVNGYATPDSVPLPSFYTNGTTVAVSADTSLVFMGKGMPDYGNAVQNNFVYLLENFANVNPPVAPIEGQLWYKNATDANVPAKRGLYIYSGTTWERIIFQSATGLTSDLDMGGFKIVDLGAPTASTDATTKQYVDDVHGVNLDLSLHLTPTQNTFLDGISVSFAEVNYLTGIAGNVQTQLDGKVSKSGDSMSGVLNMGLHTISSLGAPLNPDDAATKAYVDSVAGSGGTADGVVNAGSLDPVTGTLTLGRTIGAPVVVSGTFAPSSHTQTDSTVTHDLSTPVSQSWLTSLGLSAGQYPSMPLYDALVYMDQAMYAAQRHVHRQLIVSTGVTTLSLNTNMGYRVSENKMQLYVNGIKYYANERGTSKIEYQDTNIGIVTATGLAVSTSYSFDITVDGGAPVTVSITTPATAPYTYGQLLLDIDAALTALSVPASVNLDQYLGSVKFVFTSLTTGAGSSLTVSYAVGSLFEQITAFIKLPPVNTAITATYGYAEVGAPNEISTTVELTTAPPSGAVIEVLVWP